MFGIQTAKSWFYKRVLNKHRLLFRYWNGSRFVAEDPFVLLRKLLSTETFSADDSLKALQLPDPKLVIKHLSFISDGVREVFSVPALSDGGLTELECVNLLKTFIDWMEAVKKNGVMSLTLPTSTQDSQGKSV